MTNLSPLPHTWQHSIPGIVAWFLLLAFAFAVAPALSQTSCCEAYRTRGQAELSKKNYDKAITEFNKAKACDGAASKCPDLDALIKKARAAKAAAQPKPVPSAPKPQPKAQPQGPTDAERQAQAADQAAKAAFDLAKDIHSIPAYQSFLKSHGNSRYAADVLNRIKALEAAANPEPIQTTPTTPNNPSKSNFPAAIQKLETDMVSVTGGSFTMGCQSAQRDGECDDDEKPPRTVRVRDFSIGRYEVTQAQWRAVMGSDPSYNKGCDECPVEQVSWIDIKEFLTKLNNLTGKRYRLPTEAEWEYAARGGNQSRGFLHSGSSTIGEVAWYDGNYKNGNTFGSQKTTRPVGTKKPNELGLYDMSGNVWEWCEDDWHSNYNGAPTDGSAWVDSPRGGLRVLRGGSWILNSRGCRAAVRNWVNPVDRLSDFGFRLARD